MDGYDVSDLIAFLNARTDQKDHFVRIARLDVATRTRKLREIEAMRRLIEIHRPEWEDYVDGDGIERSSYQCAECEPPGTPDNYPCRTLRTIAIIYCDHPDYRQEWAP
jgi:hypothetical protein